MRTLLPTPSAFLDPATAAPAFGSYTGALPAIVLRDRMVDRLLKQKKWVWLGIASDEVWISLAVVRMGYAASTFAYVFDRASRRMLFDRVVIGPAGAATVADDPHAAGVLARFAFGRSTVSLERTSALDLRIRLGELEVDASADESSAPPSIAAIARLGPSLFSATEKRVMARLRGSAKIAGRRVSLDGAMFGWDYTHGRMPRHTRWKWAFAMGNAKDGSPIAFNVVEGFVGEAECAAFQANRVVPLVEPRFELDPKAPERPWRLVGDGIDLTFDVGAVHAQHTNLGLVRTHFLQPVGTFRGTIRIDARDVELEGVPGVVEDQDVVW